MTLTKADLIKISSIVDQDARAAGLDEYSTLPIVDDVVQAITKAGFSVNVKHPELTRTRDVLYDTLFLPENMPHDTAYMFVIPLGAYAGRKIKELEHTNMLMPGCLPAPEEFAIREMQCAFYQGGEWIEPLLGTVRLQQRLDTVREWPCIPESAKALVESQSLKSLIHMRRHLYGEGFLELADQKTPIITTLRTMEYFSCVLTLEHKPDIPTEFLVALAGDHFIFELP